MKRLAGLSALALVISSTSGCGWLWGENGYFRDRGNDYLEATQTAPMQLPPGVQTDKRLDPLLPIPRNVADDNAKASEFEVPRPLPLQVAAQASDFSLQRSGDNRWILAQRAPAEVWPIAHQFFEDNGFRIAEDRPQTGEFTTTWQRFDELSASMAQRLSGATTSGESETRVRVRIEPGVQRNSSEIYVVSVERPGGSTSEPDFPARSVNTGLDSILVDQMLASMTRDSERGGSVSLVAARDFDAPSRVAMSLGLYYINLAESAQRADDKPGFFSRVFGNAPSKEEIEARAERYQVRLSKVGDTVQVTVEKNINTVAPADVARRVLGVIQDNLG